MAADRKKKEKGDVSAPVKLFFTLGVLAILLCIGVFFYMKINYSASSVVDEYVDAFMDKSPTRLFRTLNLKNDKFISPDTLDTVLTDQADYKNITSYSLSPLDDNGDVIKYQIKYMEGRLESAFSQVLTLKKSEEKRLFFFDNWYIDSSDLVGCNVTLSVPVGANLTVDGTRLDENDLRKKGEVIQDYYLGDMFVGEHEFEVELEGFDPFKSTFTIEPKDYSEEPVVTLLPEKLKPDGESKNVVQKLTSKIIEKFYQALLQRRSFDFFTKEVAVESTTKDALRKRYDKMRENHVDPETHLTYVDFRDFTSKVASVISTDDCYAVRVDTTFTYTTGATVVKDDFPDLKTKDGKSKIRTILHYSNGQWKLYSSELFEKFVDYCRS